MKTTNKNLKAFSALQPGKLVATILFTMLFTGLSTGIQAQRGCQAAFDYVKSGQTVQFYDSSTHNVQHLNYQWSFGDNSSSQTANPSHSYANPGSYTVCLEIFDSLRTCWSRVCDTITIGSGGSTCNADFGYRFMGGTSVYFFSQSKGNNLNYQWHFGDGTTSSSSNAAKTYNNHGSYTVKLVISNANCKDSISKTVTLKKAPSCKALFNVTLNKQTASFSDKSTHPGNARYSWNFGDGATSTQVNPTHTYSSSGTYQVSMIISDSNCQDTAIKTIQVKPSPYPAVDVAVYLGTKLGNRNFADHGRIYLIVHDTAQKTLTAADSFTFNSAGVHRFKNVTPGKYLVKAALTKKSAYYQNYLPAYHDSSLKWNKGTKINVSSNSTSVAAPIHLIKGNNPGGPGFISGKTSQGANKKAGSGKPVTGAFVMLLDMNDDPLMYTYTDKEGYFEFTNIPYGTYKVYTEIAGKETFPSIVELSEDNKSVKDIRIKVSERTIREEETSGISTSFREKGIRIYPNPSSGILNIEYNNAEAGKLDLQIFDQSGKLMNTTHLDTSKEHHKIDLGDYPNGIYFIKAKGEDQLYGIKRIILNR